MGGYGVGDLEEKEGSLVKATEKDRRRRRGGRTHTIGAYSSIFPKNSLKLISFLVGNRDSAIASNSISAFALSSAPPGPPPTLPLFCVAVAVAIALVAVPESRSIISWGFIEEEEKEGSWTISDSMEASRSASASAVGDGGARAAMVRKDVLRG